jgi:bacillolysin
MQKKLAAAVLGTALTFSSIATGASAAMANSQEKDLMNKMDLVQKQWDKDKGSPSFLSGKLSENKIKNDQQVREFLKTNEALYKVNSSTDLKLESVETDDLGMKHYKYSQVVNSVPVEGATFLVHTDKDGNVVATNGSLYPDAAKKDKKETKADISQASATDLAWKHINLSKKDTETGNDSSSLNASKKSNAKDTNVKGDLVIHEKDGSYYLTYKIQLQFIEPYGANWQVYVDAKTGNVVDSYNAVADAGTTGSGYGVLGTYKTLNTFAQDNTYYLFDVTKPMNGVIETFSAKNGTSLPGSYSTDVDDAWNASSQGADVDAHYNAGVVYNYYKNTFNRNSFDNNGASIRSTVHYSSRYNNAFWNGSQMVYGDGDGSTFIPLSGALDVVAHELTHAVTERTAGLQYSYQSGALNESISDTFGYFLDPSDYLIGEDVYTPGVSGDALRSMSNPGDYGQPSNMSGYVNTSSDNGGVHTNSGIPNKAAYNTIQSIGKAKAEQIYYRALTVYMTPTTNFSNARASLLQAAADLYGSGSTTYNAVKSAWDQVGVY